MSAFDKWFGQREAAFATPGETDAEYTERAAKEAWNAALDGMEGLVNEWDKESPEMGNWGVKQGHRICADKLKTRIEELELREES